MKGNAFESAASHALLLVATIFALYPILWVVAIALTPGGLGAHAGVFPLPRSPSLDNFRLVLGAVWTFNMFNVVFLVSGGDPDETTDILVSEAYRWAFTRDAQYGYAAAYAVLIFGLLWLMTKASSKIAQGT